MRTFLRAQAASLVATILDFALTVLLVEMFGMWYALASVVGNVGGAIINFTIGRFWVFEATGKSTTSQAWKYTLIWLGYVVINFLLLIIIKDFFLDDYRVAKISVALVLSVTYNYLLQKSFVFK